MPHRTLSLAIGSACLFAAALLVSWGRTAGQPESSSGQARVILQERGGFFPLWSESRRSVPRDTVLLAAQDADELGNLWDDLELEMELPRLDFNEFLVLALRQGSDCLSVEPHRLLLSATGALKVLETPRAGMMACAYGDHESVVVLAVSRSALPSRFEFRGLGREAMDVRQRRPTEPQPRTLWVQSDPGPAPRRVRGRARRPAVGEGALVRLDDGSPVWVVTHQDETSSAVVAARRMSGELPCTPEGLRALIRFDPSSRRFNGTWDEYGRNGNALGPDLERYAVGPDPRHADQLILGDRVPATKRSIALPAAGPLAFARGLSLPGEHLAMDAAQQAPLGSVLLLEARLVVSSKGASICSHVSSSTSLCPRGAAPATDVSALPASGAVLTLGPPILARRTREGFSELTYVEKFSCGWGGEPRSDRLRNRRRWDSRGEMGAYATGAVSRGAELYAGGELRLGFRYSYEAVRDRAAADEYLETLVGNNIGASLRLRFVAGDPDGTPETVALVSAAPRVDQRDWPHSLPTLVTPLVPELGAALSSRDGADVFLGFSSPVHYDHYEFIPSFTWFGSGSMWLMLSLGGTIQ